MKHHYFWHAFGTAIVAVIFTLIMIQVFVTNFRYEFDTYFVTSLAIGLIAGGVAYVKERRRLPKSYFKQFALRRRRRGEPPRTVGEVMKDKKKAEKQKQKRRL